MSEAPAAVGVDGAGALSAPRLPNFDVDRGWRLHPQVAVRPEPFGALLYHFGTRKLSFLKNRTILALVESLGEHHSVRSACAAAGIDDTAQGPYLSALATLAGSKMLVPQENQEQM
jgi:mycofactocin biosynthesis protein MftB